ncbi:sex comb on midleg-like protein 1 [Microtus ochrogaster]|uniref:Sex comb on midleg-like protein 1 n=1 Tax=Microtus ochrogaster TaxID=79684 RepID=A0ABM1APS6_MICOH|nr:sex comb on midleg-like protein 1 [Microtus ochrogaster]
MDFAGHCSVIQAVNTHRFTTVKRRQRTSKVVSQLADVERVPQRPAGSFLETGVPSKYQQPNRRSSSEAAQKQKPHHQEQFGISSSSTTTSITNRDTKDRDLKVEALWASPVHFGMFIGILLVQVMLVISKTVQRLEKKIDDIDNKVTRIYYSRARSFWHYPPFKLVSRRYNYLTSKRRKLQKESQVVHDDTFSYPQSYSPTSPVRTRDEVSFDVENEETVDYTQMHQCPDIIDNAQMFQNPDSIDNAQTHQYADSMDNTESIQNTENDAVFHSDDSLGVRCISSSPESNRPETPQSPIYTPQDYHCGFKINPGSSTMTHYSDFENPNLHTTISSASTILRGSHLPRGELMPIRNPEMKQLALLEAQSTPVIDPNTFGLSSSCTKAVVKGLGKPLNWSMNDVITFLNRLDPPFADRLYSTIREHDIDGKALLLLNIDVMIKYMRMNVGVALKLSSYIQKLKKGVNCRP